MVLTSLVLLLSGCMHRAEVVKAPSPTPVAVALVQDNLDSRDVSPVPEPLSAALLAQLSARNLRPTLVPTTALADAFARQRTSGGRLALLADRADGAPLLLLVEAEARYISQLNGRMRWVVDVHLSLTEGDAVPVESTFSVPVFLLFLHQGADDALLDATPIIERNLGHLLDGYLSSLQP